MQVPAKKIILAAGPADGFPKGFTSLAWLFPSECILSIVSLQAHGVENDSCFCLSVVWKRFVAISLRIWQELYTKVPWPLELELEHAMRNILGQVRPCSTATKSTAGVKGSPYTNLLKKRNHRRRYHGPWPQSPEIYLLRSCRRGSRLGRAI